jgi:ADP-ribose pyrophosphatase
MTDDDASEMPSAVTDDPEWPILESAIEYETGWYTGG